MTDKNKLIDRAIYLLEVQINKDMNEIAHSGYKETYPRSYKILNNLIREYIRAVDLLNDFKDK